MRLRTAFLIFAITLFASTYAQEKMVLNNQDGVYVSYELTKLEETDKKDSYLMVVKAENKNDFDLYYSIPLVKAADGSYTPSPLAQKAFAQTNVRNGTGLFASNASLNGKESKLVTTDNKALYLLPKESFITAEKEFKVKHGVKPIITNSFLSSLKPLSGFELEINQSINGSWVSACGAIPMTLTMAKNEKGETVIQQFVAGKQNTWIKTASNTFEKSAACNNATLSFNKADNTFLYASSDGVSCTWSKR